MNQSLPQRKIGRPGAVALTVALMLCPSAASARTLDFVEQQVDVSLLGASALAISEDGRHVYAGASRTVVFERDEVTGELGYADALTGADVILISPDGRNLYLHNYGPVRVLARDANTGTGTMVEAWGDRMAGIHNFSPVSATISPDGRHVYVATFYSTLVVFAREPRTGVLTYVETLYDGVDGVDGLDDAKHLTVSPDGRQVYVAASSSYGDPDSVTVFERDTTTGALSFVAAVAGGPDGIEALDGIQFVLVSPDGRNVYAAGVGGVVAFARDAGNGVLSFVGVVARRARSLAISRDGMNLYAVTNRGNAAVSVYARDADAGTLSLIELYNTGIVTQFRAEAVSVTPDGRHLYVVGSADGGWIATFTRAAASGTLGVVAVTSGDVAGDADGVSGAEAMAASPDGRHLYVASSYDRVSAFSRSATTGKLQAIASYGDSDGFEGLNNAESVAVSPDGRNVYVASRWPDHAVVVTARDTDTGELDYLETHFDGVGGVDGLFYAAAVTVSPDGRNVYVASYGDDAVVVFTRDLTTGRLSFLEAYFEGVGGVTGLLSARNVIVSPDGEHVYAVSYGEDAVVAFDRDAGTGELEFIEAHFNGVDGVTGLAGTPYGMAVSSDGRYLYIASSGAVAAFVRDVATGKLSFLEAHFEGVSSAQSLTLHPDGEVVYVFGSELAVFSRNPVTGALHLVETEDFSRYPRYWGPTGIQSPDGDHLYIAASIDSLDAIVVLRKSDGLCQTGPHALCLAGNRFRVEVDWQDHAGNTGSARGVPRGTGESGLLWFFSAENWEMLIKVLDACHINDRFWLLAAATTDVEFTLRVTDVLTGLTRSYVNPLGNAASAIIDTFETCQAPAPASATGGTADLVALEDEIGAAIDLVGRTDAPALGSSVTAEEVADTFRSSFEAENLKDFEPRTLLVGIGEKCLDVEGGGLADGTPVNLFECHRQSNQRWYFLEDCGYGGCSEDFEIRGLGDKCLQPAASESGATPLVMGPCDGPEDRWIDRGYFPDLLSLEHVDTGKCADVEGGSTDNGTPVNLYDCHGGDNQIWDYRDILCVASPIHHCLDQNRFLVEIDWLNFTGETGLGRAVGEDSTDSGLFWFFEPENWEMQVKVLDGCAINGHHWVFAAGTTNVEYTLRVTDTETGQVREYFNPLGQAAPAITDTSAFATCME